jgi:hypothetical protein
VVVCPVGQTEVNGVCICDKTGLPPKGGSCGITGFKGFACNMLNCEGECLGIPATGVADTTGFFRGHAAGDLIKSIKMDPMMAVKYYGQTSFADNSHNVSN